MGVLLSVRLHCELILALWGCLHNGQDLHRYEKSIGIIQPMVIGYSPLHTIAP